MSVKGWKKKKPDHWVSTTVPYVAELTQSQSRPCLATTLTVNSVAAAVIAVAGDTLRAALFEACAAHVTWLLGVFSRRDQLAWPAKQQSRGVSRCTWIECTPCLFPPACFHTGPLMSIAPPLYTERQENNTNSTATTPSCCAPPQLAFVLTIVPSSCHTVQ